MTYSKRAIEILEKETLSEYDLINGFLTNAEMHSIAHAPKEDIVKFSMQYKMSQPNLQETVAKIREEKRRAKNRAEREKKIKVKKPKKEVLSTKKVPLTSSDITYEERVKASGYKKPDLSNIY